MTLPEGHSISNATLIKAGHRVLCIAFSLYEWEGLRRDSDPDPLDDLLQFEDEDLSESLLSLSVLARAIDEELKILEVTAKAFPDGVGTLTSKGATSPLTPREGCNKVIHATKTGIDLAFVDRNPIWEKWYRSQGHDVVGNFKAPAVLLEGTQYREQWVARLELLPFVFAVALSQVWRWNTAAITR
jgi:hypothetical protein